MGENNLILSFSVDSLRPTKGFTQTISAFKRLVQYHKKYLLFVFMTVVLSILRSYLFTLEPLYTSLIIDKVIVGGNYDLLSNYLLLIL